MKKAGFTKYQTKILTVCFTLYFCAYIGRLNMSATLNRITEAFKISDATGGLLQTVFAVSYAAGQLIFGAMSDRFEPKKLIVTGILGSACANVAFSFMNSFALLTVVWTVNGIFQSMIWTPIVLFMAYAFEEEKRGSASFVMSFTLAAGHLGAWALAMWLAKAFSWQLSYRVPGLVLACAAGLAIFALPSKIRTDKAPSGEKSLLKPKQPLSALAGTGLVFLLLCCAVNGFVRDGVITWAPTILGSNADSMLFSLVIPVINLMGILLGAYLVRRVKGKIRKLCGLMMGVVAIPAFIAFACESNSVILLALLLGIMSAILYGTNPLLTTLVPMEYDRFGRVGLAAGLCDCFIYLGSSLSGTLTGKAHDLAGTWKYVYLVWAIVSVAGCVLGVLSSRKENT